MKQLCRWRFRIIGLLLPVTVAAAQEASEDRAPADPRLAGQVGVRFTPEMARAMGRLYANQIAVERYELDPERVDQVEESVARRLMAMAHTLDGQDYNVVLEQVAVQMMQAEDQERSMGGGRGMNPETGRAFSEAAKPLMPLIRDLANGVGKDLRPLLAPKQQLKLAGDLLAFNTGLEAFSKTMDRWSQGEVRPHENPFTSEADMKLDAEGRSKSYNAAIKSAERAVNERDWSSWERYVEDAKKFYEFDDSQIASADSILRESLERAQTIIKSEEYQHQAVRNRIWHHMLWSLRIGNEHPVRAHLAKHMKEMSDPIDAVYLDLRNRIDRIPTYAQRQTADQRIMGLLSEQGYDANFVAGSPQDRSSSGAESQAAQGSPQPPSVEPPVNEQGGVR